MQRKKIFCFLFKNLEEDFERLSIEDRKEIVQDRWHDIVLAIKSLTKKEFLEEY